MDQAQGATSPEGLTARRAAGTGEAEQPTQMTPATAGKPEPKATEGLSPLQEAVRKELGAEGQRPEIRDQRSEVGSQKAEEEPEPEPEPEEQPEEQPEPAETEEQPAEEPAPAAAEAEAEDQHVPEDWPATAKARVAEEARKRRDRTIERDQWKAEAAKLFLQLNEITSQKLRPTKVLSEVVDRQSLNAAENHWKEIRRFARTNPDGAEDVLVGKDANGNDIRRDYSREEIIQMGLDADEALELLPARAAFVAEAEAQIAQAKAVYPDLWKATEAGQQAAAIVQRAPWVLQEPDWPFVIGDYLAGRKMRLAKQGKGGGPASKAGLSPGAQAILGAPKMAPAPGVIKSRSASGGLGSARGGGGERVDAKQADEEFYAKGMTSEALEDKIRRKLAASQGGREGGKRAALV
jgi:hypothetical protein